MQDDQYDIEVAGETVARLVRRGRRYALFSLDPRLREIDEKVFDSLAAGREAVLATLDQYSSED